jgi:hypothetical protein
VLPARERPDFADRPCENHATTEYACFLRGRDQRHLINVAESIRALQKVCGSRDHQPRPDRRGQIQNGYSGDGLRANLATDSAPPSPRSRKHVCSGLTLEPVGPDRRFYYSATGRSWFGHSANCQSGGLLTDELARNDRRYFRGPTPASVDSLRLSAACCRPK